MRDRIIWSAGHKAPALYTGLAFSGYFDKEDMMTLRKLGSPFQGHPHRMKLPGAEVSTGSLGQGLSLAVGVALAQKMDGIQAKTFCIMGDGEQQEGQYLGSRHGGRALQARQLDWHRRLQSAAD